MRLNGILAGVMLAGATLATLSATAFAAMDTPPPAQGDQEKAAPAVAAGGKPADAAYRSGGDFKELDAAAAGKGGEVYNGLCAACHEKGLNRAPQRAMLSLMTPESIYRALTTGVMKEQAEAAELTDDDKKAVAEFLAKRKLGAAADYAPKMCEAGKSVFDAGEPPVFEGWGLDRRNSHFIDGKTAGLDRQNVGKLTLKWSLAFPNAVRSRSQPALAAGAIFVGSHDGTVFALDRATGCARWTFHAGAEVRTGIVVAPWKAGDAAADPLMYFGDLVGNVYAVKAKTGEQVWKVRPGDHPNLTITAAPVLYKNKLIVPVSSLEEARIDPKYECCTFRGNMVALDPATGKQLWQTYLVDEPKEQGLNAVGVKKFGPSGVALWNTPAIDEKRNRLYIATGDNYSSPATEHSDAVVAMDLDTGKIVWSHQVLEDDVWNGACEAADKTNCPKEDGPDFDFGAGPILATAKDGRDVVLAGQKSSIMYGFDAEDGKLLWKNKVGRGGVVAGIHFGIATSGDTVFAPVSDVPDGNRYPEGDHPRPGMYALDILTGEYKWQRPQGPDEDVCNGKPFCHPGYSGAITATDDLVLAGANDGFIRIFDAKDGKTLWEFNTVTDFKTVNGAVAKGGSMGGGTAPLAYKGLLIMNSGYGFAGKMPGNVLLVFEAK